jgi:hypothetical protein
MTQYVVPKSQDDFVFMAGCTPDQFISSPGDFLDLLAHGGENGTNCFVLKDSNFAPAFYDLKTGLAGEILQKLSNYNCRLAIVGTFAMVQSERFRELMKESNKGTHVRFASHEDEALAWLKAKS